MYYWLPDVVMDQITRSASTTGVLGLINIHDIPSFIGSLDMAQYGGISSASCTPKP